MKIDGQENGRYIFSRRSSCAKFIEQTTSDKHWKNKYLFIRGLTVVTLVDTMLGIGRSLKTLMWSFAYPQMAVEKDVGSSIEYPPNIGIESLSSSA